MNRVLESLVVALALCSLLVTAGCGEDPKVRITMLEESNRQLDAELNDARQELLSWQRAGDDCQNELAKAHGRLADLEAQLAARPQVEPEPQALTGTQALPPAPPPTPPGWTPVHGGAMITIDGAGLFQPGSVKVRSGAEPVLNDIASTLTRQLADRQILVVGHTDNTPVKKSGYHDNWQISAERALAVARLLQKHGVAPDRLMPSGCGEHRPRVPNDSPANWERNRRVEIYALDPQLAHTGG